MRLSRRRTWHNSCATIASNCSGVRCSLRPSRQQEKGWRIPNTPGSRRAEAGQHLVSAGSKAGAMRRARRHVPDANAATTPGRWPRIRTATADQDCRNGGAPALCDNGRVGDAKIWLTAHLFAASHSTETEGPLADLPPFHLASEDRSEAKTVRETLPMRPATIHAAPPRGFFAASELKVPCTHANRVDCQSDSRARIIMRVSPFREVFDLASFRIACSASFTSSRVSLPDSTSCAITGLVRPPNKASKSSMSFRPASSREIAAAKMLALPIRFTILTALFPSRQPVHDGLHRGVGGPLRFGKCFLNLTN